MIVCSSQAGVSTKFCSLYHARMALHPSGKIPFPWGECGEEWQHGKYV